MAEVNTNEPFAFRCRSLPRVVLQDKPGPLEAGRGSSDGVPAADVAGRRSQSPPLPRKGLRPKRREFHTVAIGTPPLEPLPIEISDRLYASLVSRFNSQYRPRARSGAAAVRIPGRLFSATVFTFLWFDEGELRICRASQTGIFVNQIAG